MERIKALLAVALFVAGLIFGTPGFSPANEIKRFSNKEKKRRNHVKTDTIPKTHYILQPEFISDLAERNE